MPDPDVLFNFCLTTKKRVTPDFSDREFLFLNKVFEELNLQDNLLPICCLASISSGCE